MVRGTQVLLALCLGFAALLGACSPKEGALPTRLSLRGAAAPLQKTTVSEGTLTSRLGTPSLVVPAGNRATWYYAVAEGGAVKLALSKAGEGSWRVEDLDTVTASEWESQQSRK